MYDGIKACFFDHVPEHAMRCWTAAYISHAEKKHAEGRPRCSIRLYRHEGLVHYCSIVMRPCRGASVVVAILHLAIAVKYLCRDQNKWLFFTFLLQSDFKKLALYPTTLTRGDDFV